MPLADSFERDGRDGGVRLRVDPFDGVGLVAGERPQRAFAVRDLPDGTAAAHGYEGRRGRVDADDVSTGAASVAAAGEDRIRADLQLGPARRATASGEAHSGDHVIDGRVEPQQGPVAEDPDASRTHLDVGRRDAEPDRAHNPSGGRIDLQQGVVVAIPDPDRPFPDGEPRRSPSDGNLGDDRVRSGIDDGDGVAREHYRVGRATRRVASGRDQSGREHEHERGGERESPAPRQSPRLSDRLDRPVFSGPSGLPRCLE